MARARVGHPAPVDGVLDPGHQEPRALGLTWASR